MKHNYNWSSNVLNLDGPTNINTISITNSNTQIGSCPLSETNIKYEYSKTPIYRAPIYRKPRYIAAIFFPQIVLNMNNVN